MLPKLKCPCCGWMYGPGDYNPDYAPQKYVPHHSQLGGGPWCPGTEQIPRAADDPRPLWKDQPATPKETA